MITLPDFREKQILFINGSDINEGKIKFHNENICLTGEEGIVNQASCHLVLAVFVVGDCSLTTVLIRKCKEYGVSLFLLKDSFDLYAGIVAFAEGNYLLRQKQYLQADEMSLIMAKKLLLNKINNQVLLLKKQGYTDISLRLANSIKAIDKVNNYKKLLGIEGSASKLYFKTLFAEMNWYRRLPRVKVDEINILMDIGYSMMFNFTVALIALFGFDAYKGFYHKLFFQRKSLACDLMEPFRCLVDRQIIKSFHLKQIDLKDFKVRKGVYQLSYDKRKKYLKIFGKMLMNNKEDIYKYVKEYYYHLMNSEGFPYYKLH